MRTFQKNARACALAGVFSLAFASVASAQLPWPLPKKPVVPAKKPAQAPPAKPQAANTPKTPQAIPASYTQPGQAQQGQAGLKQQIFNGASSYFPGTSGTNKQGANGLSQARGGANAAQGNQASQPVGGGTLTHQSVVYSPSGCEHNGNRVVCAFSYSNQGGAGQLDTVSALSPVQFIDDANVPHNSSARYFVDKYGTRQRFQAVNPGDSGTYLVEFTGVDPRVSTGKFKLQGQEVGGIGVNAPAAAGNASGPAAAPAQPVAQTTQAVQQ